MQKIFYPVIILMLASCAKDKTVSVEDQLCNDMDFATDVEPIFQNNCMPCHDASNAQNGVVLVGYQNIKNEAGNPRLVARLKGEIVPRMPFGGPYLSDSTIAVVEQWISCGFPE